mmetsp:Transcript_21493/g.27102  ORF Transcript_21493/g.27102 Transcript_21493/m.27102 type:complete len:897 (-) Transcript_21493:243-2933(-)|eukprot:CAMPEP_0203672986 /NCGR_PEP_ID=MMETSP0090-20130426/10253_1 /ASSEMBLY_ACC=CAM_ASM_001088 /TAXON_ID=426623 /ORGANISM="Chaetoceros affinis, Strain CCMP159" /LENGTH=896 /DNA_ID=CAMNT_0050538485 /DNA_START=120 /DNA_END=2810 /DNA_ORIENTATION=-
MCSPSDSPCDSANTSGGLINNKTATASLQSNQQDHPPDNTTTSSLDNNQLTQMPYPQRSRNGGPSKEIPATAYKKTSSLTIAGQDRFNTRFESSSGHKSKPAQSTSPRSTSDPRSFDIWAEPRNFNSASNTLPPSSPLDYLRDIDVDLTPCTTLSTVPSRTPSEEDYFEDPWRTAKKSLEIPDLDHPMNRINSSPVAIANIREPTTTYYKKVSSAPGASRDTAKPSSLKLYRQLQGRPIDQAREIVSPRRETIPLTEKNKVNLSASTLQQAIASKKRGKQIRQANEYSDKPHQLYGVSHMNMQDQYYFNQLQQQQHHRAPQLHTSHHEPHSPRYKFHQSPNWSHHSHSPGPRTTARSNQPQATSPKQAQVQHQRHHHNATTPTAQNAGGSRPTYEVLKTLLRKKACLYEPGTSRAIALITWLVGRKLALSHGYFSRQHLQSGVHAVVADKIDSGMITRTKVNRCMQIILNSCFHYIIPRPDGTEESGDLFREAFASNVSNDMDLLNTLPRPWHDLKVSDDCLVDKEIEMKDSSKEQKDENSSVAKRVVLLCFNENVRSAEDVLRCHNDFIRDAAITGKLQLSSEEWWQFFSIKEDETIVQGSAHVSIASPVRKPASGCDIPYLTFDTHRLNFNDQVCVPWSKCPDVLGQMNVQELSKFRTTWCCKRYDHDHSLCRFAHVDVNKGWLRRNPQTYKYSAQRCPHATIIKSPNSPLKGCHLNTCPLGLQCKYAHSQEEVDYHPSLYKSQVCETSKSSCAICQKRDICPKSHPTLPRSPGHSPKALRHLSRTKGGHHVGTKHSSSNVTPPAGNNCAPGSAPIIYHKPAPSSEFERTLLFPGLQSLYRRNCAMLYAHSLGQRETLQKYSNFGDDWEDIDGVEEDELANSHSFSLYSSTSGN